MLTLERTPLKPSNTEYDNLTGYLTRTYTVEWQDDSGTRWRKTCQVINLGRPDRGEVVDPDMIEQEEWLRDGLVDTSAALKVYMQKVEERHDAIQEKVVAYLMEHGPAHVKVIARDLDMGISRKTVHKHLQKRMGTVYCLVGKVVRAQLWGLKGVHDVG